MLCSETNFHRCCIHEGVVRKCVVWNGMVYRLPGSPNSSFMFCSVSLSIWPRMEGEWIADIYFIIFSIPWVRNMHHGIFRPRLFVVPCLRAVGILLQNPDAWRPTCSIGVVIVFHS